MSRNAPGSVRRDYPTCCVDRLRPHFMQGKKKAAPRVRLGRSFPAGWNHTRLVNGDRNQSRTVAVHVAYGKRARVEAVIPGLIIGWPQKHVVSSTRAPTKKERPSAIQVIRMTVRAELDSSATRRDNTRKECRVFKHQPRYWYTASAYRCDQLNWAAVSLRRILVSEIGALNGQGSAYSEVNDYLDFHYIR